MLGKVTRSRRVPCYVAFAAIAVLLVSSTLNVSLALAQETRSTTMILTEYQFNPKTITLTVGQPVQLNVQNQGGADHNLSSDIPASNVRYQKADNSPSDLERYEATNAVNADALSGHTSVVTFTPTKAGTFGFFSEGEEALGMVGNFVVVAPAAQTAAPPASAPATASTTSATAASDGQTLSSQSAVTQGMFTAVWGDRAAQQWVQEHNAALPR